MRTNSKHIHPFNQGKNHLSLHCQEMNKTEFSAGVNISHENQNFSEADPKNFKTFPNKKKSKRQIIVNFLHFNSGKHE